MNRLVSLTLALVTTSWIALPTNTQAHEPPVYGLPAYHQHHGLRISSVSYFSPAARAGLERGDAILEVDGRKVRTPEDLHQLLHATGQRGMLTVRDARTGRVRDVRVFPIHGHIGVSVSPILY